MSDGASRFDEWCAKNYDDLDNRTRERMRTAWYSSAIVERERLADMVRHFRTNAAYDEETARVSLNTMRWVATKIREAKP